MRYLLPRNIHDLSRQLQPLSQRVDPTRSRPHRKIPLEDRDLAILWLPRGGPRLANDPGARYLLLHKPFWHDYWASADDFHMSRWGDGDSFLVNYIDHPMEGAVAGNIFLNNDPKGRSVRFGKSSSYWYSRLKVMAWAAAFEAYFEIGPIFSEAAIGNEGGFTYVPGCGDYPCDKYPDKHFKPLTNNTGWVDFVITPTVGMGWIVLEDAIEREFVDRLAKGSPAPKYKILRGSLAPSHTFANMFAGKKPWFRYFEEGSFIQNFGGPFNHTDEHPLWKEEPRYSLGVEFITLNLPLDSSSCSNCKHFFPGYGFDFNYRFAKYAYFDSVVNLFPSSGSNSQHGGAQESLAGLKLGRNLGNCGFFPISATASSITTKLDPPAVPPHTTAHGATLLTLVAPSNTPLHLTPFSVTMPALPWFTTSRGIATRISHQPVFSPHSITPCGAVPIPRAVMCTVLIVRRRNPEVDYRITN